MLMRKHVIVGGTNLRVCLVTLQGEGRFEITQTKYRLTEDQKQDDGQKLFDFCAECLNTFVETNMGEGEGQLKPGQSLPLGFTVSNNLAKHHPELLISASSSPILARKCA
jgi:hexokinase